MVMVFLRETALKTSGNKWPSCIRNAWNNIRVKGGVLNYTALMTFPASRELLRQPIQAILVKVLPDPLPFGQWFCGIVNTKRDDLSSTFAGAAVPAASGFQSMDFLTHVTSAMPNGSISINIIASSTINFSNNYHTNSVDVTMAMTGSTWLYSFKSIAHIKLFV